MKNIRYQFRLIISRAFFLVLGFLFCSRAIAVDWIYVVSDGDNLWNFSEKYLGSSTQWEKIQRLNQLPDPNWIKPGTRLRIPLDWLTSNSVPANVEALVGQAYRIDSEGASDTLVVGTELKLGDRIQTISGASVSIKFADGSIVTLEPDSELTLDHLSAYGASGMVDSRMRLHKGRLETRVTPASGPGSRFVIYSASAVSTVRGTAYRMAQNTLEDVSSIEVTHGVVDVSDTAQTAKEELNKGYGTLVKTGEPPQPPRALLPAPVIETLPVSLDKLSWPVVWSEVAGADHYRIQLSDSADFAGIRWQQRVDEPRVNLPDLPDGKFFIRVRAIDPDSLEGLDAVAELTQKAYPLAPQLQAKAASSSMLVTWKPWAGEDRYRVQVARDKDFQALISDREMSQLQLKVDYSPDGPQYLRIQTLSNSGDSSFWSSVQEVPAKADDDWKWPVGTFLLMLLIIF